MCVSGVLSLVRGAAVVHLVVLGGRVVLIIPLVVFVDVSGLRLLRHVGRLLPAALVLRNRLDECNSRLHTTKNIISRFDPWERDLNPKPKKCLESIATGSKHVQDWTVIVRNYGKTKRNKQIFFFDMEGSMSKKKIYPPYSATVVAEDFEKTWITNPSALGADATLKDCQVYPKP